MNQRSTFYTWLRNYVRFWHNQIFYRKVEIKNFPDHLPINTPLLIVANHQNTLMDALAVVVNVGERQPYFLTRADIFKKETARKALFKLKMLPVYRLRDGIDEMQQNDEIFEQCTAILASGGAVAAFPEGNHGVQYHLRSFKKGLARIALRAEEQYNWQLGVQVLPCGIYYTHCRKMGERLVMDFGKPFAVSEFREIFEQSQPKAFTQLTRRMYDDIKSLMVHIEDLPHHDDIKWLTDFDTQQSGDLLTKVRHTIDEWENFRHQQPEKYAQQINTISQQRQQLERQHIEISELVASKVPKPADTTFAIKRPSLLQGLLLIIFSPIALYGWLNSLLPFGLPLLKTRSLKDPQFANAFRIVLYALITFPIFWLLQTLIVGVFSNWKVALLYAVSLPISGYFAHRWSRAWQSWRMSYQIQ